MENDKTTIEMKHKINQIDNQIDIEKNKIKKIEEMQENLEALSKNMNKCIDLLSKSIKGPKTNNVFQDVYNSNRVFYAKKNSVLDEESDEIRKKITNLTKEKETIIKDMKNKKE